MATEAYARDHAREIEEFYERLNEPGVRPAIYAAVDVIMWQRFDEQAQIEFREASPEERRSHIYRDLHALWNAFSGETATAEEALRLTDN